MPTYTIRVNGEPHQVEAQAEMPLLWVLRDLIGLTGTKYGCGRSQCGACTVQLDGRAARSCTTQVSRVGDREVVTIEGLSSGGLTPVQEAWVEEAVPQCGYCQSGQVMSASALLAQNPSPDSAEIDRAMSRNICRCGTYQRVRKAIHRAVQEG